MGFRDGLMPRSILSKSGSPVGRIVSVRTGSGMLGAVTEAKEHVIITWVAHCRLGRVAEKE